MALTQYRVKLNQAFASYNAGETCWCTGILAKLLAALGVATAVDAVPSTTPAVATAGLPAKHAARTAHALEVPTSNADRDLLGAQVACAL